MQGIRPAKGGGGGGGHLIILLSVALFGGGGGSGTFGRDTSAVSAEVVFFDSLSFFLILIFLLTLTRLLWEEQ